MKIVTWNMGYWQHRARHTDAWRYLREQIRPDIALLQEVHPPAQEFGETILFREIHQGWGTAVYLHGPELQSEIEFTRYPNRAAAASICLPSGKSICVVSVHTPIIKARLFPHLADIFEEIEAALAGRSSIVGGDLNTARSAEKVWPRYGHGPFWESIDQGRLVDCRKAFQPDEVQTYFRTNQKYLIQDDHIFATKDLAGKAQSWEALNNPQTRGVSDDIPVIVNMAI